MFSTIFPFIACRSDTLPGVPWCHAGSPAATPQGLHLALKSGNFGAEDFFTKAFTTLRASTQP